MTDQEQFEQQLREKAMENGQPHVDEGSELELRGRITVLEEWRSRAEPVIGLIILAGVALALATLTTMLLLRRKQD